MNGMVESFGRLPKLARDVWIALALVSVGVVAAAVLVTAFGDRRLGMVFLLPVLFTGVAAGTRAALIAALVSFSIFNFFLVDPIFTLQIASAEDAVTLATFIVAALVTGMASGALKDRQDPQPVRLARMIQSLFPQGRSTMSPLAESVLELLKREPDAWKLRATTLEHKCGLALWISNGPDFLRLTDEAKVAHASFTQHERIELWRAVETWRRVRFERLLPVTPWSAILLPDIV